MKRAAGEWQPTNFAAPRPAGRASDRYLKRSNERLPIAFSELVDESRNARQDGQERLERQEGTVPETPALLDLEQLHVEDQHAVRGLLSFIRQFLGDPEPQFFALDHQLKAFRPPAHDAVERQRRCAAV